MPGGCITPFAPVWHVPKQGNRMACIHSKTAELIANRVERADTFFSRLCGLMFRKQLAAQTGLLLEPCPQIHTCFMRFAIDVVFLDRNNRVVAVLENFKPWRMSKFYPSSRCTLELPGGTLHGRVHVGDELIFS